MIRNGWVGVGVLGVLCLVGQAPCLAQDSGGPKVENPVVKLTNEEFGSQLNVTAGIPKIPEGTKIHITLTEKSTGGEAAFFATVVSNNAFRVRKVFKNKTLAPLDYVVQAEIKLKSQRQAVGDFIRREYGLPRGANVILIRKTVTIGTLDERIAFRLNEVKRLLKLAKSARGLHQSLTEQIEKPLPEDKEESKKLVMALYEDLKTQFSGPLYEVTAGVVIHPDRKTINDLTRAKMNFGRVLSQYNKQRIPRAKQRLALVTAVVDRVVEELESRLPKKTGEGGESEESKEDPKKEESK